MGTRAINYYEFEGREPDWFALKRLFPKNISRFNRPFFVACSESERAFLELCAEWGLPPRKKTIIEHDGKAGGPPGFLYLTVKDDDGACVQENEALFATRENGCAGGGAFGECGRDSKQTGRVSVRAQGLGLVAKLGMLSARRPFVPRIYLVSGAVADALRNAEATGCKTLETDHPDCYQLCITAETIGPARIGDAQMGTRCPGCGAAKLFFGSSERCFHPGDLSAADFQICRAYHADNAGQFDILNGFPIISQRLFDVLVGLRVRGLAWYAMDPPIRHAMVQVRNPQPGANS